MLQFVNPIWLAASAGVIVPVIIHLWNIRKGKVLKIGSTLLISGSAQKSASSIRITQWLLLILRCLLIIVLSMLLAAPQWREALVPSKKGWIIIDQKSFTSLYRQFKQPVDSLLQVGFELHQSEGAFEAVSLKEALSDSTSAPANGRYANLAGSRSGTLPNDDSANFPRGRSPVQAGSGSAAQADVASIDLPHEKNESSWRLIQRLDAQLPPGFTVFLFTANNLSHIIGTADARRPVISFDLRWSVTPVDTGRLSVPLTANRLANGKIRTRYLNSGVDGSFFSDVTVDGSGAVKSPQDMATDTNAINVTVYTGKYAEDARYVTAAIRAIADFSNRKLQLTSVQNKVQIPARQDWLFWLTEEDLPLNINAENIFRYSAGKAVSVKSWLASDNGALPENSVTIYQQTVNDAKDIEDEILWRNGYGDPILTITHPSADISGNLAGTENAHSKRDTGVNLTSYAQDNFTGKVYTFYSRFNPGWSDLPWSPAFPKLLLPLLLRDHHSSDIENLQRGLDRRTADVSEVMPTVVRETYKSPQTAFNIIALSKWAWVLAFLLFAAERIIAHNSSKFNRRKTSDV